MEPNEVVLIPVNEIHILNPRVRNRNIAEEIRRNIRNVGLKRPITVTLSTDPKTGKKYDLVCGQGRLEAFIDANETDIPAIIIEADKEGAHIMSLVENIARRNNSPMELLHGIKYLKSQGDGDAEIAQKTGLSREWVRGIGKLLETGEERLISAVEKGRMPLSLALKIAIEDDAAIQAALTEAYETGQLSGGKLIAVQRLLDRRKHYGKHYGKKMPAPSRKKSGLSTDELIATYKNAIKNKKRLITKADNLKQMLAYSTAALNKLLRDEHFTNQLKAEGVNDIPRQLAELLGEVCS
ncbi:plasmid partitioning protein RepB C-terminal domain-containing protein [Nitratidesulfovibrio sp. 1201_IL3209]|jgi:ParB family chromosome partitioning protein|uniref:plasmid partitioning protein RepB C-terminal domain-containing protein n=1 Tax=Nitratidesulfovibrio sp. 1201_IL3209 TaxID=3084053 RepID=UPI002FD94B7C